MRQLDGAQQLQRSRSIRHGNGCIASLFECKAECFAEGSVVVHNQDVRHVSPSRLLDHIRRFSPRSHKACPSSARHQLTTARSTSIEGLCLLCYSIQYGIAKWSTPPTFIPFLLA